MGTTMSRTLWLCHIDNKQWMALTFWQTECKPSWVLVKMITQCDGKLWQYNDMQIKLTTGKDNGDTHIELRVCLEMWHC